jgi:hypothetical protein
MQSTLKPKQDDDPHDFLVVPSDGVTVAPAREQPASLSADAVRRPLDTQTLTGSGFAAAPPVRPVDATFRAAAVEDVPVTSDRRFARRIVRAVMAVLLTVGAAVIAQHSYGDAAKQMIATWVPQSTLTSWLPLDKLGLAASPASPGAAQAQAPQATAPAPAAPDASAPAAANVSADSAQLMQSMAHDIAGLGQQIEQLKATIDQLKAGQDQLSRDVAKVSDRASEKLARIAPTPPAVPARPRKPPPRYPLPQAATAPAVPPPAAPYYPPPRQPQPPSDAANAPLPDPELSSAPRPPMPLR